MEADGVDVLMLSVGSDLPYFCGYEAMPLERITMLVVTREGDATLVIPGLERARVHERPEIFSIAPWGETEDPIAKIADLAGAADKSCDHWHDDAGCARLMRRSPCLAD